MNRALIPAIAAALAAVALPDAGARGQSEPSTAPAAIVRVHEGVEFRLRLDDRVSSATSSSGDKFRVTLTSPVRLADGAVIAAGYRGVGEVIDAQKSSALGHHGGLSLKLNYIKVGDTEILLRGAQALDGKDNEAGTAVMNLLTGVGGLFVHGSEVELKPGQALRAFADEDVSLPLPLPPPPQ